MKKYCIELDERVSEELESVARGTAKVEPSVLISYFVVKALAPWYQQEDGVINDKRPEHVC